MSSKKSDDRGDRALGMNQPIQRRDFLNTVLLGSGSLLLNSPGVSQLLAQTDEGSTWDGPGGLGDYANAHGNMWSVMTGAHKIRDHDYDKLPANTLDTGEFFDCIIVGGGISGLSASLFFRDQVGSGRSCLILENHPIFGGEARRNEFIVDGQRLLAPQGATQFPIPYPGGLIDRFYREIGLNYWDFNYQTWDGPAPPKPLGRTMYTQLALTPPTFGFYFGAKFGQKPGIWLVDPLGKNLEGVPLPEHTRSDLLKLWKKKSGGKTGAEWPYKYYGDEICRQLDGMTFEDYMIQQTGVSRETIRQFVSPEMGAGFGFGADVVSAFSGYSYLPAKDFTYETGLQMFPGGLTGIARHTVKTLIPDSIEGQHSLHDVCRNRVNFSTLDRPENSVRIRLGSTAVRVEHEHPGEPQKSNFVWVTYARNGNLYRCKARAVVMAGGGWVTRRVVRDLPSTYKDAYDQFHYGAYLRANVAVRNWRFMDKVGLSGGRWFEGFGLWTEVRKVATFGADSSTIGPDSPTVLSIDQTFVHPGLPIQEQAVKGRVELLSTSFSDYERQIRETLNDMFSRSGFDPGKDIAGIVLNRWGHAFVGPQPGFYFGTKDKPAPRDIIRYRPYGRIAFAHADLGGAQDHAWSILEAHRAIAQVLEVTW